VLTGLASKGYIAMDYTKFSRPLKNYLMPPSSSSLPSLPPLRSPLLHNIVLRHDILQKVLSRSQNIPIFSFCICPISVLLPHYLPIVVMAFLHASLLPLTPVKAEGRRKRPSFSLEKHITEPKPRNFPTSQKSRSSLSTSPLRHWDSASSISGIPRRMTTTTYHLKMWRNCLITWTRRTGR
jgi:hypothetical protein